MTFYVNWFDMERRTQRHLDDFWPERPGPILGQQKPWDYGKKGKSIWEMLFWSLKIAIGLAIVAVVAYGGYLLHTVLFYSPLFDISSEEIRGLQHISENQIAEKVKVFEDQNKNIFALDLDGLRQSIEQLPWVKEAVVRRTLPDKLIINVTERVPLAFVRMENATLLVDEDGAFLDDYAVAASRLDFPVIQGIESGESPAIIARNTKRLAAYRNLIQQLDEKGAMLSRDISEVLLADPENVTIILNDETVHVKLGSSGFQEKFRRYLAMGRQLKQKYPLLDAVDLRYPNQVVISMAGEKKVVDE